MKEWNFAQTLCRYGIITFDGKYVREGSGKDETNLKSSFTRVNILQKILLILQIPQANQTGT